MPYLNAHKLQLKACLTNNFLVEINLTNFVYQLPRTYFNKIGPKKYIFLLQNDHFIQPHEHISENLTSVSKILIKLCKAFKNFLKSPTSFNEI